MDPVSTVIKSSAIKLARTQAAVSGSTERTLADRRVFRLDDASWTEFAAILDRPAKRIPELAKLLNESAPWDK